MPGNSFKFAAWLNGFNNFCICNYMNKVCKVIHEVFDDIEIPQFNSMEIK